MRRSLVIALCYTLSSALIMVVRDYPWHAAYGAPAIDAPWSSFLGLVLLQPLLAMFGLLAFPFDPSVTVQDLAFSLAYLTLWGCCFASMAVALNGGFARIGQWLRQRPKAEVKS